MATFKEVYGMTIDEHIIKLKEEGKWTECHEKGCDIISPQDLRCYLKSLKSNNYEGY